MAQSSDADWGRKEGCRDFRVQAISMRIPLRRLRQLNPTLRVSNLKGVLNPCDRKKDCGKPGCPK
jgi:hypothetical protein